MKLTIDTNRNRIEFEQGPSVELYSPEGFEILSNVWLKVGWDQRYPYTFSWMGLPILQIPEDMIRAQEVIYRLRPDLIIETGVAHGGSMIFYASLCKAMGHGRVIGIEKGLRCRREIMRHSLGHLVSLIEGDSTDPTIVGIVHELARGRRVLMILDSDHSKAHVARELEAYHDLIEIGSYIVASDGNMGDLADVPRGTRDWAWNNPREAALEFADQHPEFTIEQPAWPYNDSELKKNVTYWPSAWLKRVERADNHRNQTTTRSPDHERIE